MDQSDILCAEVLAQRVELAALESLRVLNLCSPKNELYALQKITVRLSSINLVIGDLLDLSPMMEMIFEDRSKYEFFWRIAKEIPMDHEAKRAFIFKSKGDSLAGYRMRLEKFIRNIRLVRNQLHIAYWY